MKRLVLFILSLLILVGCNDNIAPANRPFVLSNSTTDDENPPEENEPTRPDNAVVMKDDFCGCNNTKSILLSSLTCNAFCAGKNTNGADLLYLNYTPKPEVELDTNLKTTFGWCKVTYLEGQSSDCVLQTKDENLSLADLAISSWTGTGNSNVVDISSLAKDKTYILTLKVQESATTTSEAKTYKTNSIQIRKISDNPTQNAAPLELSPVTEYSCVIRTLAQSQIEDDPFVYFEGAERFHFYFIERNRPDALPLNNGQAFCHDIYRFGLQDSNTYLRLDERPGTISLWNTLDPRFYDNNGNNLVDVNELFAAKVTSYGGSLTNTPSLFYPLKAAVLSANNEDAGNTNNGTTLGYYMTPWINSTTNNAFCPTSINYYSTNPIFKALKDMIGVDTEAIYIGKREALTFLDATNAVINIADDFLFVREGDVKRAWFYFNTTNGLPTSPLNETTVRNNKMMFYYPYDFNSPFIKKSYQRTYTIVGPESIGGGDLTNNTAGTSGNLGTMPAHDKRFGCIPVTSTP
jgi:hypothetical protein